MKRILKIVAMIVFVTIIASAAGCTEKKAETNNIKSPTAVPTKAPDIVDSDHTKNLKDPKPVATPAPAATEAPAAATEAPA